MRRPERASPARTSLAALALGAWIAAFLVPRVGQHHHRDGGPERAHRHFHVGAHEHGPSVDRADPDAESRTASEVVATAAASASGASVVDRGTSRGSVAASSARNAHGPDDRGPSASAHRHGHAHPHPHQPVERVDARREEAASEPLEHAREESPRRELPARDVSASPNASAPATLPETASTSRRRSDSRTVPDPGPADDEPSEPSGYLAAPTVAVELADGIGVLPRSRLSDRLVVSSQERPDLDPADPGFSPRGPPRVSLAHLG